MNERSASAADAGGGTDPEVVAACGLTAVPALGAASLARIARKFGSLAAAAREGALAIARSGEELRLRPEALHYLARDPDLEDLGFWAVGAASAAGARAVLLSHDEYPPLLRKLAHPPPILYVRGRLEPLARRVALVGSREADAQGLEAARRFGEALSRAGATVVSGGARGVDTAAHEGALEAAAASIAVLGCGIDVTYPPENGELFERLARGGGAVVSEFAPGTQPLPPNFPRRNRTIAGLSDAVVVVRAALRSGALITAHHAARAGRRLFAVPAEPSSPGAEGVAELLRVAGVTTAASALDVLEALGWPAPLPLPEQAGQQAEAGRHASPPAGQERTAPDARDLDQESLRLWHVLDVRTPSHVDDLAQQARLSAPAALLKLADLELKGMCVQRPGKYFLRR